MRTMKVVLLAVAAFVSLPVTLHARAPVAVIQYRSHVQGAQVEFAVGELTAALRERGYRVETHFPESALSIDSLKPTLIVDLTATPFYKSEDVARGHGPLRTEGFSLRNSQVRGVRIFNIFSIDNAGTMYGGLELAEQIRSHGTRRVVDMDRNPYLALRGTKFNIPLDLRTPSYTDMGDSAQANIETVWDFEFWRAYLDQLARNRYNYVSLWNLHPFPSMVKVPGYEDIALDDVWRSKVKFEEDYSTRTTDIVSPAMLADKEVVKQLSIEQKIDFWRRVMSYAKDRNIAFYVVTWNTYTYGVDGKHGITDALDNPKTVDYFRASVREMFRTYPLLAGIGVTAGENMGDASAYYSGGTDSFSAKENWLLATYGEGLMDVAREQPERKFRFIHRQHETRAQDIATTFARLTNQPNVDFVFSFKYAQAHALSSTTQTFHGDFVGSLGNFRTLWTIRNDDALMFRWAAPDFVREFVKNIPYEKSQGYYVGSDMWVWGREFLDKSPRSPRQLEIDKHWLHTLLWGRFAYDPTLDDTRIAALVSQRFSGVDGVKLLAAWQDASMIYPLVTGFHWANYDFQWYIEGCRSRPAPAKTASGFHSVETFISQPVHPGTDNITIPKYLASMNAAALTAGTTPPEAANKIDARADAALAAIAPWEKAGARRNAELVATVADIHAMALLGKYYAAKIRGATELALYRATRDEKHQAASVAELTRAAGFWKDYTARTSARYRNPVWTNRVGTVDWRELDAEVDNDIAIARAPLK